MSADLSQLIKFLVMECEDTQSTDYVTGLLAQAKAQIQSGNGSIGFIQSASANGKHINRTEQYTCLDVAQACREALRLYNDIPGTSPITFLDFSGTSCFLPSQP